MSHVQIGTDSRQTVRRRSLGRSVCSTSSPFDTTWYLRGAVTLVVCVAFIPGWSTTARKLRALFGQGLLTQPRSPYLLSAMRIPVAGTPWKLTLNDHLSPAANARGIVTITRSFS